MRLELDLARQNSIKVQSDFQNFIGEQQEWIKNLNYTLDQQVQQEIQENTIDPFSYKIDLINQIELKEQMQPLKFDDDNMLDEKKKQYIQILSDAYWMCLCLKCSQRIKNAEQSFNQLQKQFSQNFLKFMTNFQHPCDKKIQGFIFRLGNQILKNFTKQFPESLTERLQIDIYLILFYLVYGYSVSEIFTRAFIIQQTKKLRKKIEQNEGYKQFNLFENENMGLLKSSINQFLNKSPNKKIARNFVSEYIKNGLSTNRKSFHINQISNGQLLSKNSILSQKTQSQNIPNLQTEKLLVNDAIQNKQNGPQIKNTLKNTFQNMIAINKDNFHKKNDASLENVINFSKTSNLLSNEQEKSNIKYRKNTITKSPHDSPRTLFVQNENTNHDYQTPLIRQKNDDSPITRRKGLQDSVSKLQWLNQNKSEILKRQQLEQEKANFIQKIKQCLKQPKKEKAEIKLKFIPKEPTMPVSLVNKFDVNMISLSIAQQNQQINNSLQHKPLKLIQHSAKALLIKKNEYQDHPKQIQPAVQKIQRSKSFTQQYEISSYKPHPNAIKYPQYFQDITEMNAVLNLNQFLLQDIRSNKNVIKNQNDIKKALIFNPLQSYEQLHIQSLNLKNQRNNLQ